MTERSNDCALLYAIQDKTIQVSVYIQWASSS